MKLQVTFTDRADGGIELVVEAVGRGLVPRRGVASIAVAPTSMSANAGPEYEGLAAFAVDVWVPGPKGAKHARKIAYIEKGGLT